MPKTALELFLKYQEKHRRISLESEGFVGAGNPNFRFSPVLEDLGMRFSDEPCFINVIQAGVHFTVTCEGESDPFTLVNEAARKTLSDGLLAKREFFAVPSPRTVEAHFRSIVENDSGASVPLLGVEIGYSGEPIIGLHLPIITIRDWKQLIPNHREWAAISAAIRYDRCVWLEEQRKQKAAVDLINLAKERELAIEAAEAAEVAAEA